MLLGLAELGSTKPALPFPCLACWAFPPPPERQRGLCSWSCLPYCWHFVGQCVLPAELGISLGAQHERLCSLALQHVGVDLKEQRSRRACFSKGPVLVETSCWWQTKNGWKYQGSEPAKLFCFSLVQPLYSMAGAGEP